MVTVGILANRVCPRCVLNARTQTGTNQRSNRKPPSRPDAGDDKDTVKYAITCKIRGLLGVSGCNFIPSVDLGHERHTSPMIDHNAIDPATAKSQLNVFNNEHFVDHATDALSSLYELGILKEPVDEQHGTAP